MLLTYGLIAFGVLHKTVAALLGAHAVAVHLGAVRAGRRPARSLLVDFSTIHWCFIAFI